MHLTYVMLLSRKNHSVGWQLLTTNDSKHYLNVSVADTLMMTLPLLPPHVSRLLSPRAPCAFR